MRHIAWLVLALTASCSPTRPHGMTASDYEYELQGKRIEAEGRAQEAADRFNKEQSDAAEAEAARVYEARVATASIHPSTKVLEVERDLETLVQTAGIVSKARICGLRSDHWHTSFIQNLWAVRNADFRRLGVSDIERGVVAIWLGDTARNSAKKYTCTTLANSDALQSADQAEYGLRGGYH